MEKLKKALWGIALIVLGVLYGLKALDVIQFTLFFNGWWTLFLIVPCTIGLITEREKVGNLIGLIIGVCLLLGCQGILDFELLGKLLVPAALVILGLSILLGSVKQSKPNEMIRQLAQNGRKLPECVGIFSGATMRPQGVVFPGAELTAVFGGVKCDLREAQIPGDCVIKVTAVFGGIDILLPENVQVKVSTTSIFGGTGNKTAGKRDGATVYVTGLCLFGGVDIL